MDVEKARVTGRAELFVFGRFHARPGDESAVEEALRNVVGPSREETGCLSIQAFRSTRDPRLFYIHSRWVDEAAFDHHAGLPHTMRFIERVQALIDHPLDVTRTRLVGGPCASGHRCANPGLPTPGRSRTTA